MRRYVIKGLNKKVRDLEELKAVPSRIKVGKKVPYAVRLLPKDTGAKSARKRPSKTTVKSGKNGKIGLHVSIDERGNAKNCTIDNIDGRLAITADVGPAKEGMRDLEAQYNHVHVEKIGNKFMVHRVKCDHNHYHGCDCAEFDPDDDESFNRQPCH